MTHRVYQTKEQFERDMGASPFGKRLLSFWNFDRGVEISWGYPKEHRSLKQNALYWKWIEQLALKFGQSREDMHDVCRHKFLGYRSKTVGNTVIEKQLVSTTSLTVGEMHEYMNHIDEWAMDLGVRLVYPEDAMYAQLRRKQRA